MISSTLILVIISAHAFCDMIIPFPDVTTTSWKPVLRGEHHCPASNDLDMAGGLSTLKMNVKIPSGVVGSKSDGYLCHGAKWVTTCDYRWYGAKYITHSLHPLRPSTSQCFDAIKAYREGTLLSPGFPPESCGWNSVTDSELLSIQITPHHSGVDDYRGVWIDSMFPKGECDQRICDTVQEHSIWIAANNVSSACSIAFKQLEGYFYYRNSGIQPNKDGTFFHSSHHPNSPMSSCCRIKYCNQEGLRLHTGEWIGVAWNTKIRDVTLDSYTDTCPGGTEVKSTIGSSPTRVVAWEMERIMDFALCQNVWDKVNRGEQLSPLDLSYLSSRAPGKGLAYTIINETLHVAHVRYIRTWIKGPVLKEIKGRRGSSSAAEDTLWIQWFPFGDNQIGPNGLLKSNGTFKFPFYLVGVGALDEDLIEMANADPVDHLQRVDAETHMRGDEELFFGDTGVSKNPIESVEGWFSNWISGLFNISIIVLCVLSVLIVFKSVITLIRVVRRRRRPRAEEDVELNNMNPRPQTRQPVGAPNIIPGAWGIQPSHGRGVRQSQFVKRSALNIVT
ncbi:glycoprotein [Vesiculovirus bogdanovac]|uniref:Glycoprotein n=1 Tax=Vesiculovirus bogdanovac TaxID=1972567 RepID=K4FD99_9RHAB|nr:glycoprotein [Vesiculovirus bogdanovac]AFH89679.1 glycoprotein [Vesiculovirus bogdanovac]